jgi:hypothetical protein
VPVPEPRGPYLFELIPGLLLLLVGLACAWAGIRRRDPANAPLHRLLTTRGHEVIWVYGVNSAVRIVDRSTGNQRDGYTAASVVLAFRDGTEHRIEMREYVDESLWLRDLAQAMPWCMIGFTEANKTEYARLTGKASPEQR